MNKKTATTVVAIIATFLIDASTAHADKYGIDQTATDAGLPMAESLPGALSDVLAVAMSMISVVFFIIVLYAGIRWMVARGDEDKAEKSKETIIGAVIGIVIIMLSYALTTFVFKGTTGGGVVPVAPPASGPEVAPAPVGVEGPPKMCKPSRTQNAFDQILQTAVCDFAIQNSTAASMENDCKNGKTDSGMPLCAYNFNGVNGKHCVLSASLALDDICAGVVETECSDTYEYKLTTSQSGGITGICKWE